MHRLLPAGVESADPVASIWTAMPPILTPDQSGLDGDIASETLLEQERLRQVRYAKKLRKKVLDGELSETAMQERLGQHGRDGRGGDDLDSGRGLSLLSADRGRRKRQQVDNFVAILAMRLREGNVQSLPEKPEEDASRGVLPLAEEHRFPMKRIVDFGCGSGNLTLSLAFLFPAIEFVCVDQNETSLDLLKKRAENASLRNVRVLRWSFSSGGVALRNDLAWLRSEVGDFDLGIGLHCCGSFTDVVMELCADMCAECIVCPCCNGRVGQ